MHVAIFTGLLLAILPLRVSPNQDYAAAAALTGRLDAVYAAVEDGVPLAEAAGAGIMALANETDTGAGLSAVTAPYESTCLAAVWEGDGPRRVGALTDHAGCSPPQSWTDGSERSRRPPRAAWCCPRAGPR